MYINELSLNFKDDNKYEIKKRLLEFIHICSRLLKIQRNIDFFLYLSNDLYINSDNYSISEWMYDVDLEEKRMMLNINQKVRCFEDNDSQELIIKDEFCHAALEAYLFNSFIISINSKGQYSSNIINGIHRNLLDNGELIEKKVTIQNISRENQLSQPLFKAIIEEYGKVDVSSFQDLWEKRDSLFPNLSFSPSVKNNLERLDNSHKKQILIRLYDINNGCIKGGGRGFQREDILNATPESEATLNQYQDEHTFKDDSGISYIASWHIRFTGIAGRIFFVPNYSADKFLICYIGKKLPNVTFN